MQQVQQYKGREIACEEVREWTLALDDADGTFVLGCDTRGCHGGTTATHRGIFSREGKKILCKASEMDIKQNNSDGSEAGKVEQQPQTSVVDETFDFQVVWGGLRCGHMKLKKL